MSILWSSFQFLDGVEPVVIHNSRETVTRSWTCRDNRIGRNDNGSRSDRNTINLVDHTSDRGDSDGVRTRIEGWLSRRSQRNGASEQRQHSSRRRQLRIGTRGAIKHVFKRTKSSGIHLGRIDDDLSSRLIATTSRNWRSGDLPTERNRLGRVVNRGISLLGRGCSSSINKMNLVTEI